MIHAWHSRGVNPRSINIWAYPSVRCRTARMKALIERSPTLSMACCTVLYVLTGIRSEIDRDSLDFFFFCVATAISRSSLLLLRLSAGFASLSSSSGLDPFLGLAVFAGLALVDEAIMSARNGSSFAILFPRCRCCHRFFRFADYQCS